VETEERLFQKVRACCLLSTAYENWTFSKLVDGDSLGKVSVSTEREHRRAID
jgi:hypothetical protein